MKKILIFSHFVTLVGPNVAFGDQNDGLYDEKKTGMGDDPCLVYVRHSGTIARALNYSRIPTGVIYSKITHV